MTKIPLEKLRKDNSNLRQFDDNLWRELRKLRFKKANPEPFTNQMAYEEAAMRYTPNMELKCDIDKFMATLSPTDRKVLQIYMYEGGSSQDEIAARIGTSQTTVSNSLKRTFQAFREFYFEEGEDWK